MEEADRLTSLISESVHNLTALLQDVRGGQLKGNDLKLICAKSELVISEWRVSYARGVLYFIMHVGSLK